MNIQAEIYDYIVVTFDIEVDEDFNSDVNLFDYGYVDSLNAMKIISDLEAKYGVEITQRDLMKYPMNTINELAAVITAKIGA